MTSPPLESIPPGAFAIDATVELEEGADPAAIGAAITVELCGHWEHVGSCRWPHHTAVVEVDRPTARVRVVASPGSERRAVEERILRALATGQAPGGGAGWSLRSAEPVEIRPDEVPLATRLAGSAPD